MSAPVAPWMSLVPPVLLTVRLPVRPPPRLMPSVLEAVEVERCALHGVWLDRDELRRVLYHASGREPAEADGNVMPARTWWGRLLIVICNGPRELADLLDQERRKGRE